MGPGASTPAAARFKAERIWPELTAGDPMTYNITVTGAKGGLNVQINPGGGLAMIAGQVYPVVAGARDIHVAINPKVKDTVYAGLRFTSPCTLDILADGTVVSHEAGVVATDAQKRAWRSAPVTIDGELRNAFSPVEDARP